MMTRATRNDLKEGGNDELSVTLVEGARKCSRAATQRPRVRRGALPPEPVGFAAERTQDEVPRREWPARIEGRSRPSGPDARGRPPATRTSEGTVRQRASGGLDSRAFIGGCDGRYVGHVR